MYRAFAPRNYGYPARGYALRLCVTYLLFTSPWKGPRGTANYQWLMSVSIWKPMQQARLSFSFKQVGTLAAMVHAPSMSQRGGQAAMRVILKSARVLL